MSFGFRAKMYSNTSDSFCMILLSWPAYCYIGFKATVYTLLTARVRAIYLDTITEIRKEILVVWLAVMLSWSVFNMVLITTLGTWEVVDNHCFSHYSDLSMMSLGALDVVACILFLFWFLKPVYKMQRQNDGLHYS